MNQNLQNYGLLAIVATICIAFLLIIVGDILARPVGADLRGAIILIMSNAFIAVTAWFAATKANDARTAGILARQQEQISEQKAELATLKAQG